MKTEKRRIGDFGEAIAGKFLMKHGFSVLERNYLRPWGEIDIIAKKGSQTVFVEVKTSISHETEEGKVSRETIRPEDNIHPEKLKRLFKVVQTYCMERGLDEEKLAVVALIVRINPHMRTTRITVLDDLVL